MLRIIQVGDEALKNVFDHWFLIDPQQRKMAFDILFEPIIARSPSILSDSYSGDLPSPTRERAPDIIIDNGQVMRARASRLPLMAEVREDVLRIFLRGRPFILDGFHSLN